MPTPPAEEPLQKVTLNLNVADVKYLQKVHGHGWSTLVRLIIREYIESRKERYDES